MEELRVRLLGGLAVEGIRAVDVGSRKARTLLAALAVQRGRPLSADALAELLWGDDLPSRPHDQVGVLVSRLRRVVGAARLLRSGVGYALMADWTDVAELDQRTAVAVARLHSGDGLSARLAATMALDLDRGPLLPEEDGSWLDGPRAAVARTFAVARSVAAEAALHVGDPLGAVTAAAAALEHDPYDEVALRHLMRGHVALGRSASALAAYAAARARLAEDLGVSPDAETEVLHGAVLRGEPVVVPAVPASAVASSAAPAQHAPTVDRWDPLLQRARLELAASELDAARRDADEAIRRGGGPAALELAGWVAYYERDFPRALRLAEEAAARADEEERRASSLTLAGRVRHSGGDLAESETHLEEATTCAVPGVRAVGQVWLASLRAHQARLDEALDLVAEGAVDAAAMRHPFVIPHAMLARTYALGQRGDVVGAFESLHGWARALDDLGEPGARYRAPLANFEGWLLRSVGRWDEAGGRNRAALASTDRFQEPRVQAVLDLAAIGLDRGDADEATRWLGQVELARDDEGTMVWHQRQRLWLLRGQLAMLQDDPLTAKDLADQLIVDALARGTPRHRLQGSVLRLRAAATIGEPVDAEDLDATLSGLDRVAGLEVWRAMAELAAATGRVDLWHAAAARADGLAARTGEGADRVAAWLDDELGRLGRP